LRFGLRFVRLKVMTKAFAYLRVSGKGQVDGDGFPRQAAAIKSYAKDHDIRIVKTFREEGVTGSKETMDRPAWVDMMSALHGNGVKTILIEKLDRLARDLMVQEACIADLRKNGFTLVSVMEPDLMATDATRVLMRQLLGAVAQYEKTQIVIKLRAARTRIKAQEGRCEGRKPFGFYEGEQAAIERMTALQTSGMSVRAIAAKLKAEGVPTRTGRQWRDAVVGRILKYAGRTGR
jgi:DNA invertase Pin-like site-specific DNA recombinase